MDSDATFRELAIDQRPEFHEIVRTIVAAQQDDPAMKIPEPSEFTVNLVAGVKRHPKTESTEEILLNKSAERLNSNRDSPSQSKGTSEDSKDQNSKGSKEEVARGYKENKMLPKTKNATSKE